MRREREKRGEKYNIWQNIIVRKNNCKTETFLYVVRNALLIHVFCTIIETCSTFLDFCCFCSIRSSERLTIENGQKGGTGVALGRFRQTNPFGKAREKRKTFAPIFLFCWNKSVFLDVGFGFLNASMERDGEEKQKCFRFYDFFKAGKKERRTPSILSARIWYQNK